MKKTIGICRNKYEILHTFKANLDRKKNMYLSIYIDLSILEKMTICSQVTMPSVRRK